MEAEKSSEPAVSATLLPSEENCLEKNLSIYATIKEFYCTLSNNGIPKDKLPLLPSEEDFRQSDLETQQTFIADFSRFLPIQFKSIKTRMVARADSAFKNCKKRYDIAQCHIYPPVNLPEIQIKHGALHNAIGRFASFRFTDLNDAEEWKNYNSIFNSMIGNEAEFIKTCWGEIEKHDKYRYDVLRYKFAFWSLLIAFVVFLLVNAPVAVKNLIALVQFLGDQIFSAKR